MTELLAGMGYAFSGFSLITKPGIRLYVIVPLLINTLLFSILMLYGISEFSDLVSRVEGQWQWLSWIGWLLWPLFFIIVLTLAFFCFAVVANLIAAPFNGMLAEAVEHVLSGPEEISSPGNNSDLISLRLILAGIANEAGKFVFIMVRTIPLLMLFIVPFLQILAPLIWVLFAAWVMALEYLEYPLGNHGKEFREVRRIIAGRRPLSLGFGLGVSLLTMIPLLNVIAMPVAVSGATKMYMEKLSEIQAG